MGLIVDRIRFSTYNRDFFPLGATVSKEIADQLAALVKGKVGKLERRISCLGGLGKNLGGGLSRDRKRWRSHCGGFFSQCCIGLMKLGVW